MGGFNATFKERHARQLNIVVSCLQRLALRVFHSSNNKLHITRRFTGQAFATVDVSSFEICAASSKIGMSLARKVEREAEGRPSHIQING